MFSDWKEEPHSRGTRGTRNGSSLQVRPFPHQVRDAQQQDGGRPVPDGRVSSSYPSWGPSRFHGSDVAQVDTINHQAGPDPHIAPINYLLVEIK